MTRMHFFFSLYFFFHLNWNQAYRFFCLSISLFYHFLFSFCFWTRVLFSFTLFFPLICFGIRLILFLIVSFFHSLSFYLFFWGGGGSLFNSFLFLRIFSASKSKHTWIKIQILTTENKEELCQGLTSGKEHPKHNSRVHTAYTRNTS